MKKSLIALIAVLVLLAGCSGGGSAATTNTPALTVSGSGDITLSGDHANISGSGASVSGSSVVISSGGKYTLSGSSDVLSIVVNASSSDDVTLVLSGITLGNTDGACIHVQNADNTVIELAEGTENTVTSGVPAELLAPEDDSVSGAAIYAEDDLEITGGGALFVYGYINNGIGGKNDIDISGGSISVEAVNNGIKGNDSVNITGGAVSIACGNDGIKTETVDEAGKGGVTVTEGSVTIVAAGDGISAATTVDISGGIFDITTGDGTAADSMQEFAQKQGIEWGDWSDIPQGEGVPQLPDTGGGFRMPDEFAVPESGNKASLAAGDSSMPALPAGRDGTEFAKGGMHGGDDDFGNFWSDSISDSLAVSCKGIKSEGTLSITGGEFVINSTDHAIHSTGAIDISGGTFEISASSGKGVSGHGNVTLSGSTDMTILSSTEGIESKADLTIDGGRYDIKSSDDGLNSAGTGCSITINSGEIYINAGGDGIDSNGYLTVNGGSVYVDGETGSADSALDVAAENGSAALINGGTVIALGPMGMASGFGSGSGQCSFMLSFGASLPAGTQIVISDAAGGEVFSYTLLHSAQGMVFSDPKLVLGETYTVTAGSFETQVTLSSVSTGTGSGISGNKGGNFGGKFPR